MYTTLDIQRRLKALDYNPGPLDGIMGRKMMAAIAAVQEAEKLDIKWPGTVGPKTIAALFNDGNAALPSAVAADVARPWYDLALRKKGLHESANYSALSRSSSRMAAPSEIPTSSRGAAISSRPASPSRSATRHCRSIPTRPQLAEVRQGDQADPRMRARLLPR